MLGLSFSNLDNTFRETPSECVGSTLWARVNSLSIRVFSVFLPQRFDSFHSLWRYDKELKRGLVLFQVVPWIRVDDVLITLPVTRRTD